MAVYEFIQNYFKDDLITFMLIFIFSIIEYYRPVQIRPVFRKDFKQDVYFYIFQYIAVWFVGIYSNIFMFFGIKFLMIKLNLLIGMTFGYSVSTFISHINLRPESPVLAFLLVFVVRDFFGYVLHYCFHRFRFMWYFHAFHHSPGELDCFSGLRGDIFEAQFNISFFSFLYVIFRFTNSEVYLFVIFHYFYDIYVHSNVKFRIKYYDKFFYTNHGHWWHHATKRFTKGGQNFGLYTIFWDKLFGTYYIEEEYPLEIGFAEGSDYPSSLPERIVYPFQKLFTDVRRKIKS